MNKFKDEEVQLNVELRNLDEGIKAGTITSEEGTKKLAEIRAKKEDLQKRTALANAPKLDNSSKVADIVEAMKEKRSITLNGTGAIEQVKELAKELQAKTPVLENVRYFYGSNASTNVPILSPSIATPASFAEGATGIASDTQAVLSNKTLEPHGFISILPITMESLLLGAVDIESQLLPIFGDAFGQCFHNQILTGNGTGRNFTGIFTDVVTNGTTIACEAAGAPKIIDLVHLAVSLRDKADNAVIIMNPQYYAQILADSTSGVSEIYKEILIREKKIENTQVIITSAAPYSTSSGAVTAVGGVLSNYAFAMASELNIEPKKIVGDTNTYFECSCFANGKPIISKDFYGLVLQ